MTVYFTSNHDMSMTNSQTEQLPTDAELAMIDDDDDMLHDFDIDAILAAVDKYDVNN